MRLFIYALMASVLFSCSGTKKATTASTDTAQETVTEVKKATTSKPMLDVPGVLGFTAKARMVAKGTFDKWRIEEWDLPDGDYTKVKAMIIVDIASVNQSMKKLEDHLRADDYLDALGFPMAEITIDGANKQADGTYTADAMLNLKGVKKTVPLTFSVDGNQVIGSGQMLRNDFKVGGSGPENEVGIDFNFTAPK